MILDGKLYLVRIRQERSENMTKQNHSKQLIHNLYNSIAQSDVKNSEDISEVLLKVYSKLDDSKENERLINRLVNYIYFTALTEKIAFNEEQNDLINQLNEIGGKVGVNNTYRSPIGSKYSF